MMMASPCPPGCFLPNVMHQAAGSYPPHHLVPLFLGTLEQQVHNCNCRLCRRRRSLERKAASRFASLWGGREATRPPARHGDGPPGLHIRHVENWAAADWGRSRRRHQRVGDVDGRSGSGRWSPSSTSLSAAEEELHLQRAAAWAGASRLRGRRRRGSSRDGGRQHLGFGRESRGGGKRVGGGAGGRVGSWVGGRRQGLSGEGGLPAPFIHIL